MLRDDLRLLGACEDALEWIGNRTIAYALADCPRLEWYMWLIGRVCTYEEMVKVVEQFDSCEHKRSMLREIGDDMSDSWRGWLAGRLNNAMADCVRTCMTCLAECPHQLSECPCDEYDMDGQVEECRQVILWNAPKADVFLCRIRETIAREVPHVG